MKSIFRSRVFWLNVIGGVIEIVMNQTFRDLPIVSAFFRAHPSLTFYVAFGVMVGNLYIRMEGGVPPFRVRE